MADQGKDTAAQARQKFREALDKKQERHHATAEGAEHDGSEKSHGANGPVEKRTFRRKSGGGGA